MHACEHPFCTHHNKSFDQTHKLTHTGERPFVCAVPGCGHATHRQDHLKKHMLCVHSTSRTETRPRSYLCAEPGCNYAAMELAHLRG